MSETRRFFNDQQFTEVETPILVPIPGMEPHLTPFETVLKFPNNIVHPTFLITSPELQMKKLLGADFGNIFNITKVFRNTEIGGSRHNPEFTMLEWYRVNADYLDIMKDCENLFLHLNEKKTSLSYQNQNIDITPPWERKTINELFIEYCKIDLTQNTSYEELKQKAETLELSTKTCEDWDDIFFTIFLNKIEPFLGIKRPVFVYDYPVSQAALAKKKESNPFFAERFELYISGIELANAYSELLDPNEQLKRLTEEQKLRKKLDKTVFDIDEEFLAGLKSIKQPTGGIALGMDRLIMLFMNKTSIEEVILFPMTKMATLAFEQKNKIRK